MFQQDVGQAVTMSLIGGTCLLCSEPTAEQCHRKLVAEFLQNLWGDIKIIHL